ncbi:MAG TPA: hypothetical protein VND21_02045 [Planctomycetota bacterium]|nr:hypothetical protein [Planctomycetota bacterium]
MTQEEADAARGAAASLVALATAPEDARPAPDAAEACGVVAGRGEAVLTTWRYLRRVAQAPAGTRLWARRPGGPWEPVSPLGRTWWADAGVAVFVVPRGDRRPMAFHEAPRTPRGRGIALSPAPGGRTEVLAAPLVAVDSCDPTAPGGRASARRGGIERTPGPGSFPLALRYAAAIRGRVVEGAPILDEGGRCVALAQRVDAERSEPEVVARPADLVAPWVEDVLAAAAFDPWDLGVRFAPAITSPDVPDEVRVVREQAKTSAGALVLEVAVRGPSAGVLWPGDVVLEVEGRPLVPEVYETLGSAAAAMRPGGPADVVVWRGGRRERVTVEPRRASTVRAEAAIHHEALGATLFPR